MIKLLIPPRIWFFILTHVFIFSKEFDHCHEEKISFSKDEIENRRKGVDRNKKRIQIIAKGVKNLFQIVIKRTVQKE